jgi:hypothetical protein
MDLPNYFLADLPPEANLSPAMLAEACLSLKRNREQYLTTRSTQNIIDVLVGLGRDWLQPDFPFRRLALEQGPIATGFSRSTLQTGLDTFFTQLTRDNLLQLVEQDLGHLQRLDQFVASGPEQKTGRASIATAPELLVHIASGNLPNPTLHGMVLGLLSRSAQFVKCASRASLLPRLFAHSLYEVQPKLGSCLELAEWRGGNSELERTLFQEADCITATGSDETLAEIQRHVPRGKRFLAYGHRVSFAFVSHRVLSGLNARKVVARAAADVVAWNQLGCLSPHVLYVEDGGPVSPLQFAEFMAEELARHEQAQPRGELPVESAAAIASRRSFYEVRAAHSEDTRHWWSPDSTAWSVVFEADPRFQFSCLNRFVYVKGVKDLAECLQSADSIRAKVSTVGVAATEDQLEELATTLARWGAARVCPLGQMQNPPLAWRHDGQPALADLVRWTDWEM